LYFPRRRVTNRQLVSFSEQHFGPYGGFAQQYLFHYLRTRWRRKP
jgi:N-glycosylase/DNA lyase